MKRLLLVIGSGCMSMGSNEPHPIDHVYQVTARDMGQIGSCTDPGTPTDPAVPYRELAAAPDFPDQQAWEWCDSLSTCDPIGSLDWFQPEGDHWQRVSAMVINAPDNGIACDLEFATLAVAVSTRNVHVDLLQKSATGDVTNCTVDQALAMLKDSTDCSVVDRYDLAP